MDDENFVISRQQFDTMVLRAQVELIQKVDRLIKLLEEKNGQQETRESD